MSARIESLEGRLQYAALPSGFAEATLTNDLIRPTAMVLAPDGRFFITEQDGSLRIVKNNRLRAAPALRLKVDSSGERGLLGVALDPSFTANGRVYLYFTSTTAPVRNRIIRVTMRGDRADFSTRTTIFDLPALSGASNHNGGAIHFGPDGKLYVAVGENAQPAMSPRLDSLFGKILRINADGSIPADNPFFSQTSGVNRAIYARGLRNPYTFAFSADGSKMFINDVGQNTFEEINAGLAGANYGWPSTEGPTTASGISGPLYSYTHDGGFCAIAGGAFYDPLRVRFPTGYEGQYFFADYCGGFIKRIDPVTRAVKAFASGLSRPVDLATGSDGSFFYLDRTTHAAKGMLRRVRFIG